MIVVTACSTTSRSVSDTNPTYVILKLDDLWCEQDLVHEGWEQVVDFLNEQKVKGTIGIVGNSLEEDNPAYFDWIKNREQEGYEIWHHGFCHCRQKVEGIEIREYRGTSYEEQLESVQKTQQMAEEKLGITLRSFGAPYNSTDEHTAKVLEEIPNLKIWMYKETKTPTSKFLLNRIPEINIEYPVHQPDFEQFKSAYEIYKKEPIIVIQGHPRSWVEDPSRFEAFKQIIHFLKKEKVTFITPFEYYEMKNKSTSKTK
ncbi:MAG: DUF2334 domain-containing protein [Bacteroidota bacterium]